MVVTWVLAREFLHSFEHFLDLDIMEQEFEQDRKISENLIVLKNNLFQTSLLLFYL